MKRPPGTEKLRRARNLRRDMTPQEQILWRHLRDRRLEGAKFRRQMWLTGYIADFACPDAKLVIEADGSQHAAARDYDEARAVAFRRIGWRTLRFWNNEIMENLEGVLTAIREALPSPSHPAAPGGSLPLPPRERGI
jgi:very-short-patch-repair endonuclease